VACHRHREADEAKARKQLKSLQVKCAVRLQRLFRGHRARMRIERKRRHVREVS
jgi:hypothetical protein